ncbi:interleukin-37 [Pteropus vampyrus]|uniref:Interleukin-1 n=1 Tax=Pteropus vampyrus TaxID=132908 RepID=A0A6P6BRQ2_PTEVA|nr:interleukin-37 [Pteropus vampyrus]
MSQSQARHLGRRCQWLTLKPKAGGGLGMTICSRCEALVSCYVDLGLKVVTKDPEKFSLHDQNHKVLVLDSGTLMAVLNKSILPETFFVLASHLSSACENGSPILLAVADGELCLCCEQDKSADQPSLLLKKRKLRHLAIQHEADQQPFTFYRAMVGSWNTLESAMHPGWFISTSCNPGEPVRMTNQPGIKNTIEFSFEQVCEAKTGPAKSEKKILDLYNQSEPMEPFLFYHVQTSTASVFESLAGP